MDHHLQVIQEKQSRRYLMLLKLWEAVGGREHKNVDYMEVAEAAGFSKEEAKEIYVYLMNERFFENRIVQWGVSLSHAAIAEIEQSKTNPNRDSEHFSSTVIQYHFNAPVGSVHTAAHSTSNVTQNFGANASEVLNLIRELRQSLQSFPSDQRGEALEVVDALEEEVQSSAPRKGRIKAFLSQLGTFTAETASNVLAEAIAKSLGI
jgi:hypothetical protein